MPLFCRFSSPCFVCTSVISVLVPWTKSCVGIRRLDLDKGQRTRRQRWYFLSRVFFVNYLKKIVFDDGIKPRKRWSILRSMILVVAYSGGWNVERDEIGIGYSFYWTFYRIKSILVHISSKTIDCFELERSMFNFFSF